MTVPIKFKTGQRVLHTQGHEGRVIKTTPSAVFIMWKIEEDLQVAYTDKISLNSSALDSITSI